MYASEMRALLVLIWKGYVARCHVGSADSVSYQIVTLTKCEEAQTKWSRRNGDAC